MNNIYDEAYAQEGYYWSKIPSKMCYMVLELMPPEKSIKLLDIGCGEGKNSVFFARNGYHVSAFDLSSRAIEKTKKMAEEIRVKVDVFQANLNEYSIPQNILSY